MSTDSSSSSSATAEVATPTCQVKVTREAVSEDRELNTYKMELTAHDAIGLPDKYIFLAAQGVAMGDRTTPDRFLGICTLADMYEYPAVAPLDGATPPFYRAAHVPLHFRSSSEMDEAWALIRAHVRSLIEVCSAVGNLDEGETCTFAASED